MIPTGSRLLIGAAVLATVAAVLYGITQEGSLGTIGLSARRRWPWPWWPASTSTPPRRRRLGDGHRRDPGVRRRPAGAAAQPVPARRGHRGHARRRRADHVLP